MLQLHYRSTESRKRLQQPWSLLDRQVLRMLAEERDDGRNALDG
ncbi:MAG TPA: hypothetical protein VL287_13120 [Gemmatimonadales bacterium]|jgi:hypothetical protein|nr:hypothetical protein [Gemmatimonadales bacterium]